MITLLHISDIHFHGAVVQAREANKEIRTRFLESVHKFTENGGPIDAILVSGDIAYRGEDVDYDAAREFFDELASLTAVPNENIWVVPGNHDVNRDAPEIEQVQLRSKANAVDQDELGPLLQANTDAFLCPFEDYRTFAEPYGCSFDAADNRWEYDSEEDGGPDLEIGDGVRLHLVGINTAVCSDGDDCNFPPGTDEHDEESGKHDITVPWATLSDLSPADDQFFRVLMGHHPPSWWRKGADGSPHDLVHDRVHLQIYGHEHELTVVPDHNSLMITGGSLTPHRKRQWEPRYSILRFACSEEGTVDVDLIPFLWQDGNFGPDDKREPQTLRVHRNLDQPYQALQLVDRSQDLTEKEPMTRNVNPRWAYYQLMQSSYQTIVSVFKELKIEPKTPHDRYAHCVPFYRTQYKKLIQDGRFDDVLAAMDHQGVRIDRRGGNE